MAAVEAVEQKVVLYASDDLHDWTLLSEFADAAVPRRSVGVSRTCSRSPSMAATRSGGCCWSACSPAVRVAAAGCAGGSGDFDGTTFTAEHGDWLDHGRDCYAAVTWNDAPDGRRVLIGWLSNWAYAHDTPSAPGWRGAMTLPRDLTLVATESGPRLRQRVVPELAAYEHLDLVLRPGERGGAARRRAADLVRRRGWRAGGGAGAGGVQRGLRVGLAGGRAARGRPGGPDGVAGHVLGRGVRRRRPGGAQLPGVPRLNRGDSADVPAR